MEPEAVKVWILWWKWKPEKKEKGKPKGMKEGKPHDMELREVFEMLPFCSSGIPSDRISHPHHAPQN